MRFLFLLPFLAACTPERAQPDNEAGMDVIAEQLPQASAGGDPPAPPPPPPPAPSPFPDLLPLGEAQVIAALGTGASCALGDGGAPLMVAVPGVAVANDNGRILRLETDAKSWNALGEGGSFRADGFRIEIDAGSVVDRQGEVIVRDASVAVWRGKRGFSTSHGPRWSCGA